MKIGRESSQTIVEVKKSKGKKRAIAIQSEP